MAMRPCKTEALAQVFWQSIAVVLLAAFVKYLIRIGKELVTFTILLIHICTCFFFHKSLYLVHSVSILKILQSHIGRNQASCIAQY